MAVFPLPSLTLTLAFILVLLIQSHQVFAAAFLQSDNSGHPLSDPRLYAVGNRTAEQIYFSDRSILNTFLYPPQTVLADAPYVVRYLLVQVVCAYDVVAACSGKSLSFLGTRDFISPSICQSHQRTAEAILLLTYFVLKDEFSEEAASLFVLVNHLGLLASQSGDVGTWAQKHHKRLVAYFRQDGWNSHGSPPYSDTTRYLPVNKAGTSPKRLRKPLRWTPEVRYFEKGRSVSQVHVFPHIGKTVKPLTLTRRQYFSRRAHSPYRWPQACRRIGDVDKDFVGDIVEKTIEQRKNVTHEQHALAIWWDSKLASTGIMNLYYAQAFNLDFANAFALFLGDMIAQHDAIILAFREKVRYDLTRPQTLVRRQNDPYFTSLLPAQPHSEFPSASAALCTASLEHARTFGESRLKNGETFPAFKSVVTKSIFNPRGISPHIEVKFDTPEEAAKQCGKSRVWAGVHFPQAVDAGNQLAKGLGKIAYHHVKDLFEGRVPQVCTRCGKF